MVTVSEFNFAFNLGTAFGALGVLFVMCFLSLIYSAFKEIKEKRKKFIDSLDGATLKKYVNYLHDR